MISGLVLKNNVSIHGTLNSKDTFVNYQAAGMWEGIFIGRGEVDSFNAQECLEHETFLAFSFYQTSIRGYSLKLFIAFSMFPCQLAL